MTSLTSFQAFFSQRFVEYLYFGVLVSGLIISLVINLIRKHENHDTTSNKVRIGLFLILLCITIFLCLNILSWAGYLNAHGYLPPLERLINFILVFLLCYVVLADHVNAQPIAVAIFLTLAVMICLISYWAWWSGPSDWMFNQTWIDLFWTSCSLIIAIACLVALITKTRKNKYFTISFIAILILGFVLHFFEHGQATDLPIIPRITLLITLCPMAIWINFLNRVNKKKMNKKNQPQSPTPPPPNPRATFMDEVSEAWIGFLSEKTDRSRLISITRILAYALNSQFTYLVKMDSVSKKFSFEYGYNLINKSNLQSFSLTCQEMPLSCNAFINWDVLHISKKNSISSDITMVRYYSFPDLDSIILIPFSGKDDQQKIGFLFLFPFHKEAPISIEKLKESNLLRSLQLFYDNQVHGCQPGEILQDQRLIEVLNRLQEVQIENGLLLEELTSLKRNTYSIKPNKKIEDGDTPGFETSTISRKPISQIETELRLTLEEMARLQNVAAESNIKIHQLKSQIENPPNINTENFQVIDSIVQELRQPITSIVGYINLMQSESAGSLNSIQKKYIERVHASIERLLSLLDDLINISKIQLNLLEINVEKINMVEVIDQSLRSIIGQIREKNITLRLDVPKKLPQIDADKYAMKLIISRLLMNACMLSPENQYIVFKVKNESRPQIPGEGFIRIQVTDSGGGIPPEEVANVFSSQFQASRPLLKGVGDTGIGLVIAKWLVEAHHGNIWVESDFGKTTTINILLPISDQNPLI